MFIVGSSLCIIFTDDWQVTPRDGFYRHLWEEVPLFEASTFDCFLAYRSSGCNHHGLVSGSGSLSTNRFNFEKWEVVRFCLLGRGGGCSIMAFCFSRLLVLLLLNE